MKNLYIIIIIGIIVGACNVGERSRMPSASGSAGELIVVMPTQNWEGQGGEIVKDAFMAYVPILPQPEPQFDLIHIDPDNFTELFQSHRSILFVEYDASLTQGVLEQSRDHWAYPQTIIRLRVPSDTVLNRILENNHQIFIDNYLTTERERLINAYRNMINRQAQETVRTKFNLDIAVPEGYFVAKQDVDFVWLRQTATREELELGLLITVLPYRHPDTDFNHQTIWARRDSITRLHIPGTFPNTFMTTYRDIPPIFREIEFNGKYAVEARGLWRVEGDFMGGPFVNITFVDENTNRLIILDGFVYAPRFDKRNYMRQVEALMHSVVPLTPETTAENPV